MFKPLSARSHRLRSRTSILKLTRDDVRLMGHAHPLERSEKRASHADLLPSAVLQFCADWRVSWRATVPANQRKPHVQTHLRPRPPPRPPNRRRHLCRLRNGPHRPRPIRRRCGSLHHVGPPRALRASSKCPRHDPRHASRSRRPGRDTSERRHLRARQLRLPTLRRRGRLGFPIGARQGNPHRRQPRQP